jgi:Ser/Thr protein kinase RdoA (MazF antagonist)
MTPGQAEACVGLWAETAGGRATLVNLSENHTFRIDLPDGRQFFLRVHRPGYQSAAAIESELEWLVTLRRETDLPVPQPIKGRDGRWLQTFASGGGPRHAVLFAPEPGVEPSPGDDLEGLFETLGRFAALAHRHATIFKPSAAFNRPTWNAGAILDADGLWGDWRAAPHVEGEIATTLAGLDQRLRADLAAYGMSRERFGLIHADMRLGNLLVDGDHVTLIDFDDCGFGWYMYDFAAAISFHEADANAPAWRASWLQGYLKIRALDDADVAIVDVMILLRRMALLAWIGSHGETDLARVHADRFAIVTAEVAAPYLAVSQPQA